MEKVPAGVPSGRCAKNFRIRQGYPVIQPGASSLPRPLWTPLTSCFQNCKIEFCSIILQFCRCGGLFDAKGNPDGFLSHFSSLRNFRLGSFLTVLLRAKPGISLSFPRAQRTSDFVTKNQYTRFRIVQKEGSTSFALPFFL